MPLSGKKMIQLYKKNGWNVIRQTGSHVQLRKGSRHQTIPNHTGDLGKGLEQRLLKEI
ncbi:MAG: type II toxin-antitoxin system HicA family toxin [Spirochaetales bacterium]|nr:type II toxin-antitoxin system HicA family toxin [Spirochaetales bacterium]